MKIRMKALALGWVAALVAITAQADTNTRWINVPADNAWENAANWDNGVPYGTAVLYTNLTTNGAAWLTNTVSSYTVNYNVPTNAFNKLTLQNAGSFATTLNINTNGFATLCVNEGGPGPLGQLIINQNAVVNVNSNGVFDVGSGISITSGGVLNVNKGGALTWGELSSNQGITINAATLNIYGSMRGALGGWAGNQWVQIENGGGTAKVTIDGGNALWDGTEVGRRGTGTLTLTNNAALTVRNNGLNVGQGLNVNYLAAVNISSGILSNNGALFIARIPNTAALTGTGTINLSGGSFVQRGVTTVGEARNGTINVSGSGLFVTTNTVFVGGTTAPTLNSNVTASAKINLTGGQFLATNSVNSATLYVGSAVTGTVALAGGSLTVDRLVVTNAASSIFTFGSGALTTKATAISNGVAFAVGNGSSAATLSLLTGSHSFADGLVINTNAVFAIGGTNAIGAVAVTGNVTLQAGAVLDFDFNSGTNDWTQIAGTLTLPASATLRVRTLDGSFRSTVTVLQATAITGNASAWSPVMVNGWKYRAAVSGNQLQLQRAKIGTAVFVR